MMNRVSSTETRPARSASAASLTAHPASTRAGRGVAPRCSRSETVTIRSRSGKRSLRSGPAPEADRLSGTSSRTIAR